MGYEPIALENTSKIVLSIAGFTRGNVIRKIVFQCGVLRIVAASSKFASMFRKIPPMRIYANGA